MGNDYQKKLVCMISEFATNLNNPILLKSLHDKLMNSHLFNDLKVSINDSYVDATNNNVKQAKADMLLLLPEVHARLVDGYGLVYLPRPHYENNVTVIE